MLRMTLWSYTTLTDSAERRPGWEVGTQDWTMRSSRFPPEAGV
jgi:hypothetical protein